MRRYYRCICAVVLVIAIICTVLPINVFAEDEPLYDISEELYYGRNKLSTMENGENLVAAYDAIGTAVKSGNTQIVLKDYNIPYSQDMAYLLLDTYNKDHPEDYRFPKSYRYTSIPKDSKLYINTIILKYYTDYNDYLFDRMAKRLLDCVSEKGTEYEKALTLYNILEEYIDYDYDALDAYGSSGEILDNEGIKAYNAYGAIVNGKAVCEGYAEAYQYLLQRLGIQSYIVTGQSIQGGNHEWNLLRLDGKYYYADVTWNDIDRVDELYHSYFSITTERLLEGHIIEDPYGMLPDCLSTEMAYQYDNVFISYDVDALAKIFKGDKKKTANFYFAGEEDNFSTWWKENYSAVFNKISGLMSGVSYSIAYRAIGREYIVTVTPAGYGATVGGTLLSWGDGNDSTKVELVNSNDGTSVYTAYLDGNFNYWYVEDIADGSYKVKISKAEHKAKEYTVDVAGQDVTVKSSIFLLGDVNEDGIIDVRDVSRAKLCLANGTALDSCDVDESGSIDSLDLIAVIDKIL